MDITGLLSGVSGEPDREAEPGERGTGQPDDHLPGDGVHMEGAETDKTVPGDVHPADRAADIVHQAVGQRPAAIQCLVRVRAGRGNALVHAAGSAGKLVRPSLRLHHRSLTAAPFVHRLASLSRVSPEKAMAIGHQASDLIKSCYFAGKRCDPEKDFKATFYSQHGNCFTYDMGSGEAEKESLSGFTGKIELSADHLLKSLPQRRRGHRTEVWTGVNVQSGKGCIHADFAGIGSQNRGPRPGTESRPGPGW